MELSYQVYATQAEGGIKGDGRVGIVWPQGDLTYADINATIDALLEISKAVRGAAPRHGVFVIPVEE